MNFLTDLLCPPASAHEGFVPVTVSADVWWQWRMEWGLLLILVAVALGYFRWMSAVRVRGGQAFPRREAALFISALLLILLAVVSPIDRIGEEYLFSMHMVQHNLFMYPVVRLLMAGIPTWMAEDAYARSGPLGRKIYAFLSHPITACLSLNLIFTLWHIPFLYDWALRDRMVHNLEHLSMIVSAVLLWLPVWSPLKHKRPSYPMQILYLVAVAIAQLPVFVYVTFSPMVLYPTYDMAPRLTVLSALADQQLGGVLMKINGMLVLFAAFIGVAMEWYKSDSDPAPTIEAPLPVAQVPAL